jgi:hypothetical protein
MALAYLYSLKSRQTSNTTSGRACVMPQRRDDVLIPISLREMAPSSAVRRFYLCVVQCTLMGGRLAVMPRLASIASDICRLL